MIRAAVLATVTGLASVAAVGCAGDGAAIDAAPPPDAPVPWRSALYPDDWTPATTDGEGNFLHDFSYAGYHRSELDLPASWPGVVVDVTDHGAVPGSFTDAQPAFAAAVAEVAAAGGGVVYVPDGEYRLARPLVIGVSHLLIRGQSRDGARLYFSATDMNGKDSLRFAGGPAPDTGRLPLVADAAPRDRVVRVADAGGLQVGDHVLLDQEITRAFVDEHGMAGIWDTGPNSALGQRKVIHRRELIAVTPVAGAVELTLDVPLRAALRVRDGAAIRPDGGCPSAGSRRCR